MATWKEIYVRLAIAFDGTLTDAPEDIYYLKAALFAFVDLTTINDGSAEGYGREAATTLMNEMDLLYRQAKLHYAYDGWRKKMVYNINQFSIKHFGDLTDFINSLDWPDGCIPIGWSILSEYGHIDTSSWNVCS